MFKTMMLHTTHQFEFTALALLIAVAGVWSSLDLYELSHRARRKALLVLGASVTLALTIFTMHFVAMLGFRVLSIAEYELMPTLISFVPAAVGAFAAFEIYSSNLPRYWRVIGAGVSLGLAISIMHFIGMTAIAHIIVTYNPLLVAISCTSAVLVSVVAISLLTHYRPFRRAAVTILLAFAVGIMHFTAILAGNYTSSLNPRPTMLALSAGELSILLGCTSLAILILTQVASVIVRKIELRRVLALQARLRVTAANAGMGTLAQTLAHELSQPLTAAANQVAVARLLLARTEDENATKADEPLKQADHHIGYAGEIIRAARRLVRGNDPLVSASVEKGVDEARRLVSSSFPEVCYKLDLARVTDAVAIDPTYLVQILTNVIRNGCEAMLRGKVARPTLRISSSEMDSKIAIQIADNGPGLAAAPDEIFSGLKARFGGGLGVGLSICRTIVEAHHGIIAAKNNAEGGATFTITLPLLNEAPTAPNHPRQ